MSIAEMKHHVIEQINMIEDEQIMQNVAIFVSRLSEKPAADSISMETIFNEASQQYGDVLKKLAQ